MVYVVNNQVDIKIEVENEVSLESVYQTMKIEMKGIRTDRGSAEIRKDNNAILLTIKADDFVAIRALTNSTLRLIKTSLEIIETVL